MCNDNLELGLPVLYKEELYDEWSLGYFCSHVPEFEEPYEIYSGGKIPSESDGTVCCIKIMNLDLPSHKELVANQRSSQSSPYVTDSIVMYGDRFIEGDYVWLLHERIPLDSICELVTIIESFVTIRDVSKQSWYTLKLEDIKEITHFKFKHTNW